MTDTVSSIYRKYCPRCTTATSMEAARCECGYVFDAKDDQQDSGLAQAWQEEQLYESYLAARARQAEEDAIAAQVAHHKNPEDQQKAAAVARAREQLEVAQGELAAQARRVAEIAKSLEAERRAHPKAEPVQASAQRLQESVNASAKPTAARPVAGRKAAEVVEAAKALQAELVKMRAGAAPEAPRLVRAKPGAPPVPAVEPPAEIPAPTAAQEYVQTAPPSVAVRTKTCPQCSSLLPHSATRCRCGLYFEAAPPRPPLAPPAAVIVRGPRTAEARPARPQQRQVVQPRPDVARQAAEARRTRREEDKRPAPAKPVTAAPAKPVAKTKDCPHCTAVVAEATVRCKCGYAFPDPRARVMPALMLDVSDLINVTDLCKPR